MYYYHKPVLIEETLALLNINPCGIYVDGTLGGAGHSLAIANLLSQEGKLIAFDQDEDALLFSQTLLPNDRSIFFFRENFEFISRCLKELQVDSIDGILLDLGISSHQIDIPAKGFSYQDDGSPLIMNMGMAEHTAGDILNTYDKKELVRVFKEYGELQAPQRLAQAVIDFRNQKPLLTAGDLKSALQKYIMTHKRIKEYSKLFQALRIEVNQELRHLEHALPEIVKCMNPGARIVIISYHSLEDRIVKEFFRRESKDCLCPENWPVCQCHHTAQLKIVTRKPIVPKPEETASNSRARSARLRAAEKIGG